ncbi:restriction endonuclease subunit S [Acinetobacter sp. ANC 5378]|uniref:restriction endonuclease subunit S n=1 Tax=Acinetobacter sp. ANC 5378 TaxID=2731249 RepID=UPI00148FCCC7|nr:restriction endonuclease subunit S [Acinetobacter sp. ANC 5378]NNG83126.1 restriction endonuclease subunit S [Acinetobacter sp. ANC 5378]
MTKIKLSEICDLQNGYAFKSTDYVEESNTLSCRMSNIRLGGIFDIEYNSRYLPDSFAEKFKSFLLQDGDLVIAMTDLANDPKLLGVPTLVQTNGKNILLNQRVGKLVIKNSSKVDNKYLQYVLNDPKTRKYYKKFASGGLQINLGKSDLLNVEIFLPPIDEQRRIASILDKADELRKKRQQSIKKLDQLLQTTFVDMFGDPVSNPKEWNLGKLGDVVHSAKDGPHVSPNYSETGIPFLSTRHVRAGKIIWEDLKFITEEDAQIHWKKCKPTRGDILYTKGGTTGLAAVVDTDIDFAVWVHVALLKTNHDKVRAEWLVSMLNTQYCYEQSQRYTHGIANRDLGLKRMVNIEMYLPPLDEQDKFVNFKNKLMKNNVLFQNSSSSFEKLFNTLQNKAFSGNL